MLPIPQQLDRLNRRTSRTHRLRLELEDRFDRQIEADDSEREIPEPLNPAPQQTPRPSAHRVSSTETMDDSELAGASSVNRNPESSNPHEFSPQSRLGATSSQPVSHSQEDSGLGDDSGTDAIDDIVGITGALDGADPMEVDNDIADQGFQFFGESGMDDVDFDVWPNPRIQVGSRAAVVGNTNAHVPLRLGYKRLKRPRAEDATGTDARLALISLGAQAMVLYHFDPPNPQANDLWPDYRNVAKLPARYHLLSNGQTEIDGPSAYNNLLELERVLPPITLPQRSARPQLSNGDPPGWPPGRMPTELYEEIAGYLDRDDIKSMRLVCREFDRHVSQILFNAVVVPFNTEIYGMLEPHMSDRKGKKKAIVENTLSWKNANGDDIYDGHGLDVFRGFGNHIRKFAMSFEVNEDSLGNPPQKFKTKRHTGFWGNYDWPPEEYCRFEAVAGLENAADETPRMTVAFSELSRVQELGLSLDSGLGWLNGPDRSIRARILQKAPVVFGATTNIPDRQAKAQRELWEIIKSCHPNGDVKLATLYRMETSRTLEELHGAPPLASHQPVMPYLDPHLVQQAIPHDALDLQVPPSLETQEDLDLEQFVLTPSQTGTGFLYTSTNSPTPAGQLLSPIIPTSLTKAQKEWLLETEWAQRAFLSSYMLSVIDNPSIFGSVHTLNLSQISDRYLHMLNRPDFWDALVNVKNVTVQVIPGWRTVHKDEAGFVETPKIDPGNGIAPFYDLLRDRISNRENIQQLTFGWATGGEHAEGFHARNKHVLPLPILPGHLAMEQVYEAIGDSLLQFPHVESLTLKNCWMTPALLEQFVKQHDKLKLKCLTLDSVSLTAKLSIRANADANANVNLAIGGANLINGGAQNLGHALVGAGQNAMHAIVGAAVNNGHWGVNGAANGMNNPFLQPTNAPPMPAAQYNNVLLAHIQTMQGQIQQLQAHHVPHVQVQVPLAALQVQLQTLQNQLQPPYANLVGIRQALAQAHQRLQNIINLAQPPVAGPGLLVQPAQPVADPHVTLKALPRSGSWLSVLDVISPGLNLKNFGSEHSHADPDRKTKLEIINFVSCGYVKLSHAFGIEQPGIDDHGGIERSLLYLRKWAVLAPAMLNAKYQLLGEIVQEVDQSELAALVAAWDIETGWQDKEAAEGPEFDGLLKGGTGRFRGAVRKQPCFEETEEELGNLEHSSRLETLTSTADP